MLPCVLEQVVTGRENDHVVVDEDTILFKHDTTVWEALDVRNHISGTEIGNIPKKIDLVRNFAENDKMELNLRKCKEMMIDFRRDGSVIPVIKVNDCILERVSSFKLLGLWIGKDLRWKSNTEYIVNKAAKWLYFLKILKGYNALREDLKTFYVSMIISVVEYGAQIWHGGLTEEQCKDIERIQKRAMKIICPGMTYEQALIECSMETLVNRKEVMCIKLMKDMKEPTH